MRRLVIVALVAGCAAQSGRTRVALQLQGPAAGPAEQRRCLEAAQKLGAVVDAYAPVQALVTLDKDGNRLQVLSQRRGLLRDEKRASGASVESLCQDAVTAAAAAGEPAMAGEQPAPGAMPAHDPPPSTVSSGGSYRGPIQE